MVTGVETRRSRSRITLVWCFTLLTLSAVITPVLGVRASEGEAERVGPWNPTELRQVPEYEWGETVEGIRQVYYRSEPYQGRPTRVFAWYGCPENGERPLPGIVLVHGGGGKAFREWVQLWVQRGYAAIAMDLAGCGPDGQRLPDGGPGQSDVEKFAPFDDASVGRMWTYHAIAAVVRAHSFLAAQEEVDPRRIAVTGISWGGYLTCIAAGVDDRFAAAVPVYGCGFLHEDSVWLKTFQAMDPELRERWIRTFDPSRYLGRVKCPIFFLNGTNDFAYPLDSYRKSFDLVPGRKFIRIEVRMKHSHPDGWAPKEIGWFVDSVLRGGEPLPELGELRLESGRVSAEVRSVVPPVSAGLHYTRDDGPWQERNWISEPARIDGGRVVADVPTGPVRAMFLSVTDARGAMVSTSWVEGP
ncbi:MAG: hypothetical protein Kow0040_04030 [Thermogutta sp.]